jgi:ketosteroid isomerase-like protein/quinol monooxygenase YgiN
MRNAAIVFFFLLGIAAMNTAKSNEVGRLTVGTVQNAFQLLTSPATAARFFDEYVADDVVWTVMGTNYMAGTTRGKARFIAEDVARLREFLASDIVMAIDHIHVAGNNTAIVEMRSRARLKNGAPYNMTYIWVVGFSKNHEEIEWVRAYVDTEVLNSVFRENERLPNVFVTSEIEPSAGKWEEAGDVLSNLKKHSRVAEAGLERFQILADKEANRYKVVAEFANYYTADRYLGSGFFEDAFARLGRLSVKPLTTSRYTDGEADPSPASVPRTGS